MGLAYEWIGIMKYFDKHSLCNDGQSASQKGEKNELCVNCLSKQQLCAVLFNTFLEVSVVNKFKYYAYCSWIYLAGDWHRLNHDSRMRVGRFLLILISLIELQFQLNCFD